MFAFKTRLLLLLAAVKHTLVPLRATPPTFAEEKAFMDYEDERGYAGLYPSPAERYQMDVEWRDQMCELPLLALIRWRLAVAWMPFWLTGDKRPEQRLVGEWLSRRLFPDIYGIRRRQAMKRKEVRA